MSIKLLKSVPLSLSPNKKDTLLKKRKLFSVSVDPIVERSRYAAEQNDKSVYTPIFA